MDSFRRFFILHHISSLIFAVFLPLSSLMSIIPPCTTPGFTMSVLKICVYSSTLSLVFEKRCSRMVRSAKIDIRQKTQLKIGNDQETPALWIRRKKDINSTIMQSGNSAFCRFKILFWGRSGGQCPAAGRLIPCPGLE